MSESESHKNYPIVPPSELRCVWMTAGVLSYQLCEKKFDCEQCPLDLALRQRYVSGQPERLRPEPIGGDRTTHEATGGMRYARKHVWVRATGEHMARVGIDPGLASVLVSPKAVVLPANGEQLEKNKMCCWIVMDGGTLPLISPVAGKVRSTNTYLAENPLAVCLSPLGQGWLFELSVQGAIGDDPELLSVPDAAAVFAHDDQRFQTLLSAELSKGGAVVGQTLADGGQPLSSISEMLGPSKYFKIVRSVYA